MAPYSKTQLVFIPHTTTMMTMTTMTSEDHEDHADQEDHDEVNLWSKLSNLYCHKSYQVIKVKEVKRSDGLHRAIELKLILKHGCKGLLTKSHMFMI